MTIKEQQELIIKYHRMHLTPCCTSKFIVTMMLDKGIDPIVLQGIDEMTDLDKYILDGYYWQEYVKLHQFEAGECKKGDFYLELEQQGRISIKGGKLIIK